MSITGEATHCVRCGERFLGLFRVRSGAFVFCSKPCAYPEPEPIRPHVFDGDVELGDLNRVTHTDFMGRLYIERQEWITIRMSGRVRRKVGRRIYELLRGMHTEDLDV